MLKWLYLIQTICQQRQGEVTMILTLKRIKSVAYSSQASHTGQLDFSDWLADTSTMG